MKPPSALSSKNTEAILFLPIIGLSKIGAHLLHIYKLHTYKKAAQSAAFNFSDARSVRLPKLRFSLFSWRFFPADEYAQRKHHTHRPIHARLPCPRPASEVGIWCGCVHPAYREPGLGYCRCSLSNRPLPVVWQGHSGDLQDNAPALRTGFLHLPPPHQSRHRKRQADLPSPARALLPRPSLWPQPWLRHWSAKPAAFWHRVS